METGKATIVDVAREAGVSLGTASNVLNRPDRVAPATRRKVERAIERLGFVPSGPARQLRSGNLTSVGAVLLDIRNPFYTDVARGIEDRLDRDGRALLIGSSDGDPGREARYLRLFEGQGVSGVIAASVGGDEALYRDLLNRGMNVVLLESSLDDLPIPSVRVDNRAGARAAAKHLIALGFGEIVMFNGPHQIRQCVERAEGARQALSESGRDGALIELPVAEMNSVGGAAAAEAWFADHSGPAAIFCANDLIAIGVQRVLTASGAYDPARYPIVGFDDIDVVADRAVPITSVRQPTYQLGHRAADMLESGPAGRGAEHVTFVPELIVRASTAPT
ncbi:MAG: LacI family transcriptional regulator [Bifidobacteriaceae bacterium]|jgi:LacI family transcriptional regulator|nr:LacI family transcriptional regulator [Bifidobacteriaceae bacterium]